MSYTRADRDFAEVLRTKLEAAGHSVWTDQEILPGDNWAAATGSALNKAEAMVALESTST